MGCHTWYRVPYKTDKKEIIHIATEYVNEHKYISDDHKKMYQYAIDNELTDVVGQLAGDAINGTAYDPWIVYLDISDYALIKYNEINGTSYSKRFSDYQKVQELNLERYSNEPRIGGYPDRIIRSYDDMVDFVATGFDDEDGKHFNFYTEKDRLEKAMEGIKQFFINYPKGIITFG